MATIEAIERAREFFPEGSTAYTILRSVSRSGMQREIGLVALHVDKDGRIIDLHPNYCAAQALGWSQNKHNDAIKVRGVGMDMGFHLVDTLSYALYGRSNALKHRWL